MNHSSQTKGIIYTALSYLLWGLLPLYWKVLDQTAALDILAHRIIWSFVFMCGVLLVLRQWKNGVKAFRSLSGNRKEFVPLILSSVLISINWYVYIWAVSNGYILEASLGYYINPLVSIVLGIVFLKEKLTRMQGAAVLLAALGVLISAFQYGSVPYIALMLAFSFGLYGLAKKTDIAVKCHRTYPGNDDDRSGCSDLPAVLQPSGKGSGRIREHRHDGAAVFSGSVNRDSAAFICGRCEKTAALSSRYFAIYRSDHYIMLRRFRLS